MCKLRTPEITLRNLDIGRLLLHAYYGCRQSYSTVTNPTIAKKIKLDLKAIKIKLDEAKNIERDEGGSEEKDKDKEQKQEEKEKEKDKEQKQVIKKWMEMELEKINEVINREKEEVEAIAEVVDLQKGWNKSNALMLAAAHNDPEYIRIVQCLLDNKADPSLKNELGSNALMIAAENGNHDVVKKLDKMNHPKNKEEPWIKAKNNNEQTGTRILKYRR